MPDESIYLNGQITSKAKLSGSISQPLISLTGELSDPNSLSGSLSDDISTLSGQMSGDDNKLFGQLSEPLRVLTGILSKPEVLSGKLSNGILRGYSAYDIAVLAGFEGTEEEWLESLRGKDGRSIEIRNNNGIIEYKYETQYAWTILVDLNKFINDYEKLINKPSLDGTVLLGDRDLSENYLRRDRALTNMEIEELLV